ncbi:Pentapeptide repeat-containing protein [Asanoa hainanensis]|uniref:Pentapeptide repeat-containing protein n=1 Tax=Asanoa hainanensis TaxID=560556 RepID=A0A239J201_9ACTN|nr:pentapeptide repeat-containing protein [Asanoa hainanensis]SNS99795.1 Pentapeptide repeat-containing protein [Asanoa hainanensis]
MPPDELVRRWSTGDGVARARDVLERLAKGTALDGLGLATVDGLVDLRGLPAGGLDAHGGEVVGADLSHAWFAHAHLTGVRWRRCRFDRANLSAAVLVGGGLTECTMRRADLREAVVAGGIWSSVHLAGITSNHLSADHTTFTGTTFPALRHVEFTACAFVDCRFTGRLAEVRFLGRGQPAPMLLRDVTFASSDFRYAEFDGMDFDNVEFPDDGALIVVPRSFKAVAERAGMISLRRRDDVGKQLRRFLSEHSLRPGLSATAGWAVSRRDLAPDVAELAASTLHEAQQQLRAEGVIP